MSLQFVLGPSGSGKSEYLQNLLIRDSIENPNQTFLLVAPDQYTMQIQKQMVVKHPDRAFSNIEVLGFSRLSHRILEEVGGEEIPVLDDTGKSLIIRHVSEQIKDELGVMKTKIDKAGYIHEIKSAISEFMQYGLSPDDVASLVTYSEDRQALASKLTDLERIYRAFKEYKEDKFLTVEETLDIVCRGLHKSKLVQNAVIVFDGFTGFTPIQERVIQELLIVSDKVYVSFDMDDNDDPYTAEGEQELFALSKRSISRIKKLAEKASVIEEDPVMLDRSNMVKTKAAEILHIEKNLFRYPYDRFEDEVNNLFIYKSHGIRDEITDMCSRIRYLTDIKGLRYSDIAVVVGNLSAYADDIIQIAGRFDIPIYMDYSRNINTSAFIEAIRSALEVVERDFSIESVMRHLRNGFAPLTMEECDELENYLKATGIRGYNRYLHTWTVRYRSRKEETESHMKHRLLKEERLNNYRTRIAEYFAPIADIKETATIKDYSVSLYEFLHKSGAEKKLSDKSIQFKEDQDYLREIEYRQIYAKVCDLLDQIVSLTGDEIVAFKEYIDILDAGFGEIKLGNLPQKTDMVIVGDMERSRLSNVSVLMFMGVNDGNIPGSLSSGGIISDLDRMFLKDSEIELAPTPKEQMYIQRLYLYMNMTKPSDALYISFSQMDSEGTSMRPSYLISQVLKMFPKMGVIDSIEERTIDGLTLPAGKNLVGDTFAEQIRTYASGEMDAKNRDYLLELARVLERNGESSLLLGIEKAAFDHYSPSAIDKEIAQRLYGNVIRASVSRFEKHAACAYAHFLSYAMALKENEEFGFERNNLGEVFHEVLERFADKLKEEDISWSEYTAEESHKWVDEILEDIAMTYGETVLLSTARSRALIKRMNRILKRTVDTLQYQIKKGDFIPTDFEKTFSNIKRIGQDKDGRDIQMKITGKIDRIDLYKEANRLLIKIIDYKTGNRDFDLSSLYYGLTLQLAVYMNQALDIQKNKYTGLEIMPAGMFFYHMSDPVVDAGLDWDDDKIISELCKAHKMKGALSADSEKVIHLDREMAMDGSRKSDVYPIAYTAKNDIAKASSVYSDEQITTILDYADKKLEDMAFQIIDGEMSVAPKAMNIKSVPCKYCDYRSICRIDSGIPGYEATILKSGEPEEILQRMKDELH